MKTSTRRFKLPSSSTSPHPINALPMMTATGSASASVTTFFQSITTQLMSNSNWFRFNFSSIWFCITLILNSGCDQNHEQELDPEEIYKNFVLRVCSIFLFQLRIDSLLEHGHEHFDDNWVLCWIFRLWLPEALTSSWETHWIEEKPGSCLTACLEIILQLILESKSILGSRSYSILGRSFCIPELILRKNKLIQPCYKVWPISTLESIFDFPFRQDTLYTTHFLLVDIYIEI